MGSHRQSQRQSAVQQTVSQKTISQKTVSQQTVQHLDSMSINLVRWVRPQTSQVVPFVIENSVENLVENFVAETSQTSEWQQLTQIILNADRSQDGIRGLCQIIGQAFQADCCFIAQQSKFKTIAQTTCWAVPELAPLSQVQTECFDLLQQSAIASQWQPSEVLAIADLDAINLQPHRKSKKAHKSTGLRSILAIHTELYQQINGMVVIGKTQPYNWQDSDVMLLQNLAPQVAIALSQMQLEQQIQQQMQYQNLNNQLTSGIRHNWDLKDLFELAVEGTAIAVQASRSLLISFKYPDRFHKNDGTVYGQATVSHVYPYPEDPTDGLTETISTADCALLNQLLLQKTEPIFLPRARENGFQFMDSQETASFFHLQDFPSLILMPIENQGIVLGCLALQHHQSRLWSGEELSFIKLVAAQLSTAIIQSHTLQQVQSVVAERTSQLRRSLKVQAKLYEKTRQQVEQLQHLNAERERFLSTVSHELLTPLTSMRLAIQMLRNTSLTPDRTARYLDILEQQCSQETQLINDMLALQKLEVEPATLQHHKVDLSQMVNDIVARIQTEWTALNLRLEVQLPQQSLWLYSDPDSLTRILLELLNNAKKYAQPQSCVTLRIDHQGEGCHYSSDAQIRFTLTSQGYGIQPDELPFIFDKFRRGEIATQQAIAGTGLGLALVKSLVEHLNGAIAVTSQPLSSSQVWQTCFTLTFAQFPDGLVLQASESV
jgi:signal transduction histidine kinase